jgi:hypothetical protein
MMGTIRTSVVFGSLAKELLPFNHAGINREYPYPLKNSPDQRAGPTSGNP